MVYLAKNLIEKKHCFFGAEGGISGGKYASLNTNLSSQDTRLNIERNFERIAAYFDMQKKQMFTLRQSVSADVIWADAPSWFSIAADGMATDDPDILLGIKTADCAPVLMADYKHGVIGAAHAGWRGAYKGVVENVLHLMIEHGAHKQDIAVAIGPCMQQNSFEVREDMLDVFLNQSSGNMRYFKKDGVKYYFDLSRYLIDKIHRFGVENITDSGIDTYTAGDKYFSFRRYTNMHLVEIPRDYPTQFSCIRL
jgi:hypothetical protein